MGALPPDQRVLYEELSLGEERVYDGEALEKAAQLGDRPGVTSVLRIAALKAVGVQDEGGASGARCRCAAVGSGGWSAPVSLLQLLCQACMLAQ